MRKMKGRISWVIFVVCKVLTPALLVMVTESNEIETYGKEMAKYYKKSLRGTCSDLEFVNKFNFDEPNTNHYSDLTLQELLYELDSESNIKTIEHGIETILLPNETREERISNEKKLDKILGATLRSYLMFLDKENKSSPLKLKEKTKKQDVEYCCEHYRKIAKNVVSCLKKQKAEEGGELIPFPLAMFLPCLGAILVAMLLAPMKRVSASMRRQSMTSRNGTTTTVPDEPDEKLENIKYYLHFIVDIVVFYLIVHKIKRTGSVMMGSCVQNQLCLPKYTSLPMIYLLAMAQTPWISILWNFVH